MMRVKTAFALMAIIGCLASPLGAKSGNVAQAKSAFLLPFTFPALVEAFVPLTLGGTLFPSGKAILPVTFAQGNTVAWVRCEPGARFDILLPQGASFAFLRQGQAFAPEVLAGDGTGFFASVSLIARPELWLWTPTHVSQRHALVICPKQAATKSVMLGMRVLTKAGRDAPRLTGAPMRDARRESVAVRPENGLVWESFHRLKADEPLRVGGSLIPPSGVPAGTPGSVWASQRFLVRVRPLFDAGAITTGWATFRLRAEAKQRASSKPMEASHVELRSAWQATSRVLSDGSSSGEERTALLTAPVGLTPQEDVALSCTQDCLIRVEEIEPSKVTDSALASGVSLALARTPLSFRTLPPDTVATSLPLHALSARYQEPFAAEDNAPREDAGEEPAEVIDTLKGTDLYASPRRRVVLSYAVPKAAEPQELRELRLSAYAPERHHSQISQTSDAEQEFLLVGQEESVNRDGKQTLAVRLLWSPALSLPETKRRDSASPALEVRANASVQPAFASRVVLPLTTNVSRVRLVPMPVPVSVPVPGHTAESPLAPSSANPSSLAFAVSVGVRVSDVAPVATSRLFDARLEKMKAHFASVARARRSVSSLRSGAFPGDLDTHVALERRIEAMQFSADARAARIVFEERQDALTSAGQFALGRSLLWETALTHSQKSVACEAARVMARLSDDRSEFQSAAMAWFAAFRGCGERADLQALRQSLLRQGAFASAREFEPALEAAGVSVRGDSALEMALLAAHREANPRARAALFATPSLARVPHVHFSVENALREASGFLVAMNKETGKEEQRVSSAANAPSRWNLVPGRVYIVSWRRVLAESAGALPHSWIRMTPVGGREDEALHIPMDSCEKGDGALVQGQEGLLCSDDSFVVKLPSHWNGMVTFRPLAGRVGLSIRERLAASGSDDLSPRESDRMALAALVARKEASPSLSASLVAEGDAFFRAAREPGSLRDLHARLVRGLSWTPLHDNLLHAGVWKEDARSSAWPLGADERVARLHDVLRGVVGLEGREYRLGPANQLAFQGGEGVNGTLRIVLKSDGTAPLEQQRVRALRNGRPETVLALSDSRSAARLQLPSKVKDDVLALELEDHISGQGVFVSLPSSDGNKSQGKQTPWREPNERAWFVATPLQPMKALLPGPGRLRIEERLVAGLPTRERYQTLRVGWNTIEIRPEGGARRSYVRLALLAAAPGALVSRPRAEPWTVENLARENASVAALGGNLAAAGMEPPQPRLTWGESRAVSWRLVSDASVTSRPDGELLPGGERRVASSLGVVRKQVVERWALYSSSATSMVGVRGRMPIASVGQKFTVAPDAALFRYVLTGEGSFQRPYVDVARTEWSALMRHEIGIPLSFSQGGGQGFQIAPRFGFFYRWWSLDKENTLRRYPNGEVDTLVSNDFFRAHPYGAFVGARFQTAPFAAIPSRVLFDLEGVSGPDAEPLDPARLASSLRYVHLVGDFDLEGFGEWERSRKNKDAVISTRVSSTSVRSGGALRYVFHQRQARLAEVGARGGHDFRRRAPFFTAAFTWHLSPDALFRHDAPDDILMREERIRRAGPLERSAMASLVRVGGLRP